MRAYQEIWLKDVTISKTPMAITTKLDKDEQNKNVDIILYCSIIGSLLYLIASRLDIMFSVCHVLDFNLVTRVSLNCGKKHY